MADAAPTGVLIVNLGTPDSPAVADVRRYLREFLSDPKVIDLPVLLRWPLVHLAIVPFRAPRSAAAYASIWTDEGSPLRVHSRAFANALAASLGPGFAVELGMRYGQPSLEGALERLDARGAESILALPLFPQFADSSTGSALARIQTLRKRAGRAPLDAMGCFPEEPGFIAALAQTTRKAIDAFDPDHLLLSFHGLPERHLRRADPTGQRCLVVDGCCDGPSDERGTCYRAQCFATARSLASALDWERERWSVSFQSRLGRAAWIQPYTDHVLQELAGRGVQRLAVVCPSFVADCLETLEEISLRAREQWRTLGGTDLLCVPCLNAEPRWVATVAGWVRDRAARAR